MANKNKNECVFEKRVVLFVVSTRTGARCASSISYATFVLSQLSACIPNCMDGRTVDIVHSLRPG